MQKIKAKYIIYGVIGVFLLSVTLGSFFSVGPTERALVTTFGKPSKEVLEPGLHFKVPFFQSQLVYDLSPIEYEREFSVGADGALSRDQQTIGVRFTLYWQYDESRLYELATGYSDESKIFQPISTAIKAAIKDEVGKWSVEEIVNNQNTLQTNVRNSFIANEDVKRLPINVTGFAIGNWDWDDNYDAMIKKTMARKQEVEQMKQEVALSEQQAQKQVKEAEAKRQATEQEALAAEAKAKGEAAAIIAKAEGEKAAKIAEADAIAYYNQKVAQNLAIQQQQWRHEEIMLYNEKWDGQLVPTYIPLTAAGGIVNLK